MAKGVTLLVSHGVIENTLNGGANTVTKFNEAMQFTEVQTKGSYLPILLGVQISPAVVTATSQYWH